MPSPTFRTIARTDRYLALETPDGELALVELYSAQMPRQLFRGRDAVRFLRAVCDLHPLLYCWRQSLLANPHGRWTLLRNVAEVDVALGNRLHICCAPAGWDPDTATWRNGGDRELRLRLNEAGLVVNEEPHRTFCERLLASAEAFPHVAGFLRHPVHGDPAETWLRPAWAPPARPAPGYPHLETLFSAFALSPVDHAALYCYFFGCFHAASLDHPRPLLLLDSAEQGRGKGEIGTALTVLLDAGQSAVPISGGQDQITSRITSHLVDGSRVLAGQNVSGVADWNNEFIVCLSTDGNVKQRALYDREATPFSGIVGSLSVVYGQASFHMDVVDRAQRVFLAGRAQRLRPQPAVYVKEHRNALIDEIMLAHSRATSYTGATHSRFSQFEEASAAAYAEMTKVSHDEVSSLLLRARRGARGLLTEAVRNLHRSHAGLFIRAPHTEVVSGFHPDNRTPLEGARALGYVYKEGEWHEETAAKNA